MSKYACVRTDNMSGTLQGKDLVSLKFDGKIENGCVVKVGAFLEGEREVREAVVPTSADKKEDLALIASPEVIKSKTYHSLSEFVNEDGSICRGYRLADPKQLFSITKEAFVEGAAPVKGDFVVVGDNCKWNVAKSEVEGTTTVGKVVLVEGQWYVIEVA